MVTKATAKTIAPTARTTAKPRAKSAAATVTAAKPAAKTAPETKATKVVKLKNVRDSFNMPQDDYARIATLKKSCQSAGLPAKKSELLRAGLQLLSKLSAAELKKAVAAVQGSPR